MTTTAGAVEIPLGHTALNGDLTGPDCEAMVVFAHGSGSSRHSPRNRQVAARLRRAGLGTLLLDLLTEEEEAVDIRTAELRFDIGLLASRLALAVEWLDRQPGAAARPVGMFGASTGAAAALTTAAQQGDRVGAIVSRGGRPDLAGDALSAVRAPTLLIVGGRDPVVHDLNVQACEQMRCERRLDIVPGATHLFEEPGTLDRVSELAADWFGRHLGVRRER